MNKLDNARGQIAEKIIKTDYKIANIKIFYLMISKENNKLNIAGLSNFLQNYEKKEELLLILENINKQKQPLPDFICIDCSNRVFLLK